MAQNNCEIEDCLNEATHLAGTETKIIEICKEHWNEIYKK